MANINTYKGIVVKEDPKTSLAEAGIYPLQLENGMKVVCLAHAYFPNHDRNLLELIMQYLRDYQPDVVILLGGMIDESAFKSLIEDEANYLHEYPDAPEVSAARLAPGFEAQVMALGKTCGDFIKSFAEASGGHVIYIPSATHLSMPNEVRLMEAIQRKKKVLDNWSSNHCDLGGMARELAEELLKELAPEPTARQIKSLAKILESVGLKALLDPRVPMSQAIADLLKSKGLELPSDPSQDLPTKLAQLFHIDGVPNITVTRYNAAVKVNGKTLFMIGDFRRRHAGSSSLVEWEQRGGNIVRSFDGKLSSAWKTAPKHTLPGLVLEFHDFHEVGYLWDVTRMGHLRDYDRRAPGFWKGEIVEGELFGSSVIIMRGADDRRAFVVDLNGDFKAYTEESPGCLPNGEPIKLAPRKAPTSPATPRPGARTRKRSTGNQRRKRS